MSGWTFDERFKAWAEREAMPLVKPNNALEVVTSKLVEAAFLGGVSSRDAEVQELRKLVDHAKRIFQHSSVSSGYCMCGETPEHHSADCGYIDRGQWESELWLKRAVLAGGEEGEPE